MHLFSHNEFTLNLIPLNIFERLWLWDLPYRLIYQYFFFLTKKLTGKNANRIRFILSLLNNILSDISRLNSQKTSWLLKYQWFYKCLIAESKIFYPISIFYETSWKRGFSYTRTFSIVVKYMIFLDHTFCFIACK